MISNTNGVFPNPADLVTFIEEILNANLHLCAVLTLSQDFSCDFS